MPDSLSYRNTFGYLSIGMPVAVMNHTQTLLHIAIVDDLETDREKLEKAVSAFFSRNADVSCDIMTHASGEELLEAFSPGTFDLAFLDIQMEGMSGIELAKTLRALDTKLLMVFLTSSREYAFDAFPVHPFDYLVKHLIRPGAIFFLSRLR